MKKAVYPYEYLDDRGELMKHHYLKMKDFYSQNRVCKNFEIKNLEYYHDLYV